jgi:hypothetical protein
MSNETVSPDSGLNAIEEALCSLSLAGSRIDRELVMYRAGQASVHLSRTRRNVLGAIAASLALVAFGEGVLLARRPPAGIVEKVVVVHEPATAPAPILPSPNQKVAEAPVSLASEDSLSLGQADYERLSSQVLRYGLDGLPASPMISAPASGPTSSGQMLRDELRRLLEPGDPS